MPRYRIAPIPGITDESGQTWSAAIPLPPDGPLLDPAVAMKLIGDGQWQRLDVGIIVPQGTGTVWVRFPEPQPDDDYSVIAVASWTEIVETAAHTVDGFTVKFGRSAPKGGTFHALFPLAVMDRFA